MADGDGRRDQTLSGDDSARQVSNGNHVPAGIRSGPTERFSSSTLGMMLGPRGHLDLVLCYSWGKGLLTVPFSVERNCRRQPGFLGEKQGNPVRLVSIWPKSRPDDI